MAAILVVNIGSTSLKYRLIEMGDESTQAWGYIERIGEVNSPMAWRAGDGSAEKTLDTTSGYTAAIEAMLAALEAPKDAVPVPGVISRRGDIAAIGFKVVHGGYDLRGDFILDDGALERMEKFSRAMPAHNPPYINAIRLFKRLLPDTLLVGAFETAFHRDIPEYAAVYGLPYEWREKHRVRRYGFHGASHRYVSERLAELIGKPLDRLKLITCHLGGSSSLAAIRNGVCVDTSMGFTTQSGVPMAKRSADFDPFVIPYIMDETGLSFQEVFDKLVKEGGLAGISGLSGDMRDLMNGYDTNPRARLAVDHFVHEVKKYIGAYYAVMNGLDALVFTGGIGENAVEFREMVCRDMDSLGIRLDAGRNAVRRQEAEISPDGAGVRLFVIPTNEELVVARKAAAMVIAGVSNKSQG